MASSPQKSPSSPKSPTPKSPSSRKKDDSFLGKLGGTLARRKKAKEGKTPAKQNASSYQRLLSATRSFLFSGEKTTLVNLNSILVLTQAVPASLMEELPPPPELY